MALTPLATTADLSARGVDSGERDLALAVASAAVRDAAGVAISSETSTVTVVASESRVLALPGPVTAVSAVTVDGSAVSDYAVLPNGLWRTCGWGTYPTLVTVTFTHGYATVPADIVDLTCQLAIAWLTHTSGGGGSTAGLTDVAIDDARESYTDEAAGQVSPVFIPQVTRDWLAARFGGGATVVETAL